MTDKPLAAREAVVRLGEHALANLALDLACVVARLEQIDAEQETEHWLWDRVMTCDVRRLEDWTERLGR